MLLTPQFSQLKSLEHSALYPSQSQIPFSQKMYPQLNTQNPPLFQNSLQNQSAQNLILLQNQFVPQQSSNPLSVQNSFFDADHQIQQEIQNLQKLQMQLKLRQQQFNSNFASQQIPIYNFNQQIQANENNNNINNIQFQMKPNLINSLQNTTQTNIQKLSQFQKMYPQNDQSFLIQNNQINEQISLANYPPNQFNQIGAQQQQQQNLQFLSSSKNLIQQNEQQQMMMRNPSYLLNQQQMMNHQSYEQQQQLQQQQQQQQYLLSKRKTLEFQNNFYSKADESNETLSPETLGMLINKKRFAEDIKSSSTLLESNSNSNKQNIGSSINYYQTPVCSQKTNVCKLYKQLPEIAQSQNSINQFQQYSSTQSLQNSNEAQLTLKHMNHQIDTSSYNNYIQVKKESRSESIRLDNNHNENNQYQNEQFDQANPENSDNSDKRCKKEIQNDSNYTKNLLKGFRRQMNKKWKNDKEYLEKFQQYFYNNTLSNEFILLLLENSVYTAEFQEFLNEDPSWWIKEAKIKEPARQLKFFETVKNKNYIDIRTKRKSKGTTTSTTIATTNTTINTITNISENVIPQSGSNLHSSSESN